MSRDASGCFPEVEDVVELDERVGSIDDDPQRARQAAIGGHELAVVDSISTANGQTDTTTLERLQLADLRCGHVYIDVQGMASDPYVTTVQRDRAVFHTSNAVASPPARSSARSLGSMTG